MAKQNNRNHTRFDPKFHFVLLPLCLVCFVASIVHITHSRRPADVLLVPVTLTILLLAVIARSYAVKVQDRVIRLEENVRLHWMGIDPSNLTIRQMIAIRFAPDEEVPALVQRAVAEKLTGKQIKQAIVNWRADVDRV